MFVRKNKNRSGSVSVQVIEKRKRKNVVIKTIGSGTLLSEIDLLVMQANQFIEDYNGQIGLFSEPEDMLIETFVSGLKNDQLKVVGPKLVLEKIFESIGYGRVTDNDLFRHLVICRVISPGSKLKTVQYMARHYNITISEQTVYRYLDRIEDDIKPKLEQITYEHTRQNLGGKVGVVFYDMTTLYFEAESQDDLRKIGYSKDGKHQHPQIMIGLLVATGGYPIGYEIFEGNTSETKTLIPVLEKFIENFGIEKPIVVADSALLSKSNLEALINNDYEFILGGRIKNESEKIKNQILQKPISEVSPIDIEHPYGRLIVSYSKKRSAKDLFNRERGLKRIEAKVKTGKLTKEAINNRGYNKYLKLDGDTKVSIDYESFKSDLKWDGLKGYVTNTKLKPTEVIANYSNLWQVEKAFRMSKSDLKFRPVFHRKENRIKAHILICFASYTIYKDLERILKINKVPFSIEKAMDELKEIQQLEYQLPKSKTLKTKILSPNKNQQILLELFK